MVRIDSVVSDGKSFPKPQAVKIDNTKGVVGLVGYTSSASGATGDITIASLNVTVIGKSGSSSLLGIKARTLGDTLGNEISATMVNGSLTVR